MVVIPLRPSIISENTKTPAGGSSVICMGIILSANEPGNVADLPGSGEADNVADTGKRANEAAMEDAPDSNGTWGVRPMPGVLGISRLVSFLERYSVGTLAVLDRSDNPGGLDQLHSSPARDRLASQIRDDSD